MSAAPTRRSMLGMIAGVPVAATFAAIPVEAMALTSDLDRRIAAYRAVLAEEAAHPKGMPDGVANDLGDRRLATFRAVADTPAGSVDAVTEKLEAFATEYQGDDVPYDDMMLVLADLRRLAAH